MNKLFGVVVLAALFASRADAAPIVVSAGDFLTFNFDLTGETPPPPYVLASVFLNREGLDFIPCDEGVCELADIGVWNFYTELNGTGSLFFTYPVNLGAKFDTEMQDGVFSATLQMTEGSITVDPVACGITADGARTSACPPAPPPVPEPVTLSLLAIAGAGVYLRRRA